MIIFAFCAALATAVLVYVFWPPVQVESSREKTQLVYFRERRYVAYENLRDLNFEHEAGKLAEADYRKMKAVLTESAAAILAEIARLESVGAPTGRK